MLNCKAIQESDHKCLGKGVACKVRIKELCGCKSILLHCELVRWIKKIKDQLVPALLDDKPKSRNKFLMSTNHSCANRNQIYEWKHIYQSFLRKCLNNHILIPFFTLSRKPNIEPALYKKLKKLVANEDDYINDNKAELELKIEAEIQENQPVSEEYLELQEQLLIKVDSIKNWNSLCLFL